MEKEPPKTNTGDMAWLITTVEALDQERAGLKARVEALEREVANSVKRRDSVEISSTRANGIGGKVYIDCDAGEAYNNRLMDEELRARAYVDARIAPKPEKKKEGGA